MRATRIFALSCRERNDPADLLSERRLSQSCQVMLKARPSSARPVARQLSLDGVERCDASLEPCLIAHDANIVPHCVKQLFAQTI